MCMASWGVGLLDAGSYNPDIRVAPVGGYLLPSGNGRYGQVGSPFAPGLPWGDDRGGAHVACLGAIITGIPASMDRVFLNGQRVDFR